MNNAVTKLSLLIQTSLFQPIKCVKMIW